MDIIMDSQKQIEIEISFTCLQELHKAHQNKLTLEERVELVRLTAALFKEQQRERHWIENDEDGFTGWRKDKYNIPVRIAAAANRYGDYIVTGARHYCVLMNAQINLVGIDALRAYAAGDYEQGFVDQFGNFLDRKTALKLAIENGQMHYNADHGLFIKDDPEHNSTYGDELFSENLW